MSDSKGDGSVHVFRAPSSAEQGVIRVLLEAKFPGDSALREQMSKARVRTLDVDGSLEISVEDGPLAEVAHRIPVEAVATDSDGASIHILLHVVDGMLQELEYFREDSRPVQHPPTADDLQVLVL
jgi:hypothetical protein